VALAKWLDLGVGACWLWLFDRSLAYSKSVSSVRSVNTLHVVGLSVLFWK